MQQMVPSRSAIREGVFANVAHLQLERFLVK